MGSLNLKQSPQDENAKLVDILVRWLMGADGITMDPIDADEPEISDYNHLPDSEVLAERVRCCLQEPEEVTKDFTTLFDDSLFKFDTSLIPEARHPSLSHLSTLHHPLACCLLASRRRWTCTSSSKSSTSHSHSFLHNLITRSPHFTRQSSHHPFGSPHLPRWISTIWTTCSPLRRCD